MNMEIQNLSAQYTVKPLAKEDVGQVYDLCKGNTIFYQYHPPFVTVESILEDMEALPPGKEYRDKHYIGFFQKDELVAVMDLIEDYPRKGTALIGFFATDPCVQGKGVGTGIISDCVSCLRELGFEKVRLGIDNGNPQSKAFWTKNQFQLTGEEVPNEISSYFMMERTL